MKLLIITQKVNQEDSVLGFFHSWIREFASRFEEVTVICLEKGVYNLPENVEVFSLGKEEYKIQDTKKIFFHTELLPAHLEDAKRLRHRLCAHEPGIRCVGRIVMASPWKENWAMVCASAGKSETKNCREVGTCHF